MYNWLVFLHVFFAFLFILAHGPHVIAMLKFRVEPDPERSMTFFNTTPDIKYVRYFYLTTSVFGFAAAFATTWWKQGWVWLSALVFMIVTYAMYKYGGGYFGMIQDAAISLIEAKKNNTNLPAAQKQFDQARNAPNVIIVSIVGILGLAIILWLMRFKPF